MRRMGRLLVASETVITHLARRPGVLLALLLALLLLVGALQVADIPGRLGRVTGRTGRRSRRARAAKVGHHGYQSKSVLLYTRPGSSRDTVNRPPIPKPRIHRFPDPEQILNKSRVLAPCHFVSWRTSHHHWREKVQFKLRFCRRPGDGGSTGSHAGHEADGAPAGSKHWW